MDAIPVQHIDATPPANAVQLHIASFIAHVKPHAIDAVARWLQHQPRVEIHTQSPEGKFAVVVETENERAILDLLDNLDQQQGVLSTAMIYHEIIDGEEHA